MESTLETTLHSLAAEGAARWGARTSRSASDIQLTAAAWDLIAGFETFLQVPVKELSVDFHSYREETDDSIAATTERLNQVLESVRQLRATNTGARAQSFLRDLNERKPELAR